MNPEILRVKTFPRSLKASMSCFCKLCITYRVLCIIRLHLQHPRAHHFVFLNIVIQVLPNIQEKKSQYSFCSFLNNLNWILEDWVQFWEIKSLKLGPLEPKLIYTILPHFYQTLTFFLGFCKLMSFWPKNYNFCTKIKSSA